MKTRVFIIVVIFLCQTWALIAQNFPAQNLQNGQWLKEWILVGPVHLEKQDEPSGGQWKHIPGFETDYLQSVGGEKSPVLKDGKTVEFKGGKAKCILFHSPDSMVNLDLALSKDAPVLAYGYTEVEAPEEGIKILALGSNDGCRLWLNGEQIWDVPTERGLFADDDMIPVMLKKGKNTILIKVEERGNSWGFCMRFLPFSITDFSKNGKLFSVTPKTDGTL
jgi:hypothetical protein